MAAGKTLLFMDAEQLTASWAAPPLLFVSYEMSYANFFYLH